MLMEARQRRYLAHDGLHQVSERLDWGSMAVLLLAAAALIVFGAAVSSGQSTASQVYEGVVTDTHCGAKHSPAVNQSAGDCTRMCVHGGEQFALVDGENTYVLEGDIYAFKRVAGERVKVTGQLTGNKISVASLLAQ
ncbi:MAG TPA: hypothetical protein VND65_10795 [Candidatus Binatia bacterium]|nr:hypothetical protein [Candidatus Binatia bacterium]